MKKFVGLAVVAFTILVVLLTVTYGQTVPVATYNDDLVWDHFLTDVGRPGFVQQYRMDNQPASFVAIPGLVGPVVLTDTPTGKTSFRVPVSTALAVGQHRIELRACATAASGTGLDCGPTVALTFEVRTTAPAPTSNAPAGPAGLRFKPRSGGGN